jgi:dynein heavy chain 1
LLNSDVKSFQRQCLMSRQELENKSVEAANSSSEAVSIITYVQGLKRNLNEWTHKVITYREAQNVLMKQRFQFPSDWTFTDQINGEWSAFNEILVRKDQSIQKHVTEFQTKILSEEKSVDARTTELVNEWDTSKPIDEDLNPEEALRSLQQFESKLKTMNEDQAKMVKAKEALELGSKINKITSSKVLASLEELNDLKEVWSEINKIHKQIETLKEKQWITIQVYYISFSVKILN